MATYTPDAYNEARPVSSDLYQTPEELRAIKQRITQEGINKVTYGREFQKVFPTGAAMQVAAGPTTINLDDGLYQRFDITGNVQFTITPPTDLRAGSVEYFTLALRNAGSFTITWPAGSKFNSGTAPVLTAGLDILVIFREYPGGPWIISASMRDVKVP